MQRIEAKGPDAERLCDDVLCKLLRNGKCCLHKSNGTTDEVLSRKSKHQQKGQSLGTVRYGARDCPESLTMQDAGYPSVKEDAQGSRGWKNTHVPTYEVLDSEASLLCEAGFWQALYIFCMPCTNTDTCVIAMQYLTQKGGQYLRLLQLVDQLIVPGIKEARAQAKLMPSDNRQQQRLRQDCLGHLDWLHARKWTFFALAALYYPTQKQHRIFKDHPFFQI